MNHVGMHPTLNNKLKKKEKSLDYYSQYYILKLWARVSYNKRSYEYHPCSIVFLKRSNNPGVITTFLFPLFICQIPPNFFVYLSDLLCLKLNIPPDNLLDEHHSKFRSASQVLLLKLDECDLNLQKRKSYYDIPITLCNCQDTLHGQLPTCCDLIFATLPT